MSNSGHQVWNIPNILSMIRLLLVPPTVALIVLNKMVPALILFLVACATDLLDGWIARHYNMKTVLGTWLDPLADKLMAICVLVSFTLVEAQILPWYVTLAILLKEMLMLIGGIFVVYNGYATPSNRWGKLAALVLNVCIGAGFLYEYFTPWYLYATYVALVLVWAAFIQYAIKNMPMVFHKNTQSGADEE